MPFEEAVTKYRDAAICIGSMWSEEMLQQVINYDRNLADKTWDLLTSMTWETSERVYTSTEERFIKDNFYDFENLYDRLADQESKDTLEGILNYRLTRDKEFLRNVRSRELEYFDKTIIKSMPLNKEIIDGGGFDGDTIDVLLHLYGRKDVHLNIHCYEAAEENCKKLKKGFRDGRGIELLCIGQRCGMKAV